MGGRARWHGVSGMDHRRGSACAVRHRACHHTGSVAQGQSHRFGNTNEWPLTHGNKESDNRHVTRVSCNWRFIFLRFLRAVTRPVYKSTCTHENSNHSDPKRSSIHDKGIFDRLTGRTREHFIPWNPTRRCYQGSRLRPTEPMASHPNTAYRVQPAPCGRWWSRKRCEPHPTVAGTDARRVRSRAVSDHIRPAPGGWLRTHLYCVAAPGRSAETSLRQRVTPGGPRPHHGFNGQPLKGPSHQRPSAGASVEPAMTLPLFRIIGQLLE